MDNNYLVDATKTWSSTRLPELYLPSRIKIAFPNKSKDFCPFSYANKTTENDKTPSKSVYGKLENNLNTPTASLQFLSLDSHEVQFNNESGKVQSPKISIYEVFKNVCIYVEVHSGKENRSANLKEFIADFGVEIHNRIKKATTHVIFKSGKLSTYLKAKSLNIPIVSLLWIEECRKELRLVDPSKFPISDIDKYENPELYNTFKRKKRKLLGINISNNEEFDSDTYLDSPMPTSKTTNFTLFHQNQDLCETPNFNQVKVDPIKVIEVDPKSPLAKLLNFDKPDLTDLIDNPIQNSSYKIMTRRRSIQFTSACLSDKSEIVSQELKTAENISPIKQNRVQNKRRSFSVPRKEVNAVTLFDNKEGDSSIKRNTRRNSINVPKISETENTINSLTTNKINLSRHTINFRKIEEELSKNDSINVPIQIDANKYRLNTYAPPDSILEEVEEQENGKENILNVFSTPNTRKENKATVDSTPNISTVINTLDLSKSLNFRKTNFAVSSMILDSTPISNAANNSSKINRRQTLLTPCNLDETALNDRNRFVNSENSKSRKNLFSDRLQFRTPKRLISSPNDTINSTQQSTMDVYYKKHKPCTPPSIVQKMMDSDIEKVEAAPTENDSTLDLNTNTISITKKRKLFTQPSYTDEEMKTIMKSITPRQHGRRSIVNSSSATSASKARRSFAPSMADAFDMLANTPTQIHTPILDKWKQKLTTPTPTPTKVIKMNFEPKLLPNVIKNVTASARNTEMTKYLNIPSSIVSRPETDAMHKKLPTLVTTNMHQQQINVVKQAVRSLGGFKIEENVTSRTTHLISYETHRTFNMLRGLIRGLWILNFKWIIESLEAGRWLHEEMYEVKDFSRTVEICRAERQAFGNNYKIDLFGLIGPIYVSEKSTIPKKNLIELIKLCAGTIVENINDAKYVIGDYKYTDNDDKYFLNPLWILDSIMVNRIKKTGKYLLKECEF